MDNFGVKYTNLDNANHLLSTLKKCYRISVDWEGEHYLGLTIKWDYANRQHINISMLPDYVSNALTKFQNLFAPGMHHMTGPDLFLDNESNMHLTH